MQRAHVCRIGLSDGHLPYVVPVNFGYQDRTLYFHCAMEGRKLDMIRKNNHVCFEVDIDEEIVRRPGEPCGWSARYRSVIGFGRAFVVQKTEEKSEALNIIMQHYGGASYAFSSKELEKVVVVRVAIDTMTGKKAGYD